MLNLWSKIGNPLLTEYPDCVKRHHGVVNGPAGFVKEVGNPVHLMEICGGITAKIFIRTYAAHLFFDTDNSVIFDMYHSAGCAEAEF
jgi:hypothetical protein